MPDPNISGTYRVLKRFLATALTAVLAVSLIASPTRAAERVTDSAANVDDVTVVDSVRDYYHGFEDSSKTCFINASRSVSFVVTIPKLITLDGTTKSADYSVTVAGDISGSDTVVVKPDSTFVLYEDGDKAPVNAAVNQPKTAWNFAETMINVNGSSEIEPGNRNYIGTTTTGTVSAPITAGKWSGHFNFIISLNLEETEGPEIGKTMITEGYPGLYNAEGVMTMTWDMIKVAYADEFNDNSVAEPSGVAFPGLTGSLVIGEDITGIDYFGFSGSELTNIYLPESVSYVYDAAFSECSNLGMVKLPSGLSHAGSGLFAYDKLETLIVEYDGVTYSSENFDDLIPAFEAHGIDVSEMECGLFD